MENIAPSVKDTNINPVKIVQAALGILKNNWKYLCGLYAFFLAPLFVISLLQLGALPNIAVVQVLVFVITTCIGAWGMVSLFVAIDKITANFSATIKENITEAGRYFVPYLTGMIIVALFAFMILFVVRSVVPLHVLALTGELNNKWLLLSVDVIGTAIVFVALYFLIRCSLYGVCCVVENSGPIQALKRSRELVKNHVNPVVGTFFLSMLIVIILAIPLVAISFFLKNENVLAIIGLVYQSLMGLVMTPFLGATLVVLYQKLREVTE